MKTKFKLITIILTMCMVLAVMGVGVFAATSVAPSASGSVSFNALSDVVMTISGDARLTGAENPSSAYEEVSNASTEGGQFEAWTIGNIAMNTKNSSVTYTFTFKNDNAFSIVGTYTAPTFEENVGLSAAATSDGKDVADKGTFVIAENATCTFIVVIKVTDKSKDITSATTNFGFAFEENQV